MSLTLVLGGARSGKSAYAQQQAEAAGPAPVIIVTAEAGDAEMADRIARHRADRGPKWSTVEAPVELVQAIETLGPTDVVLIDCLTLWLSNLMMRNADTLRAASDIALALARCPATIWVVSNEVGMSIVPENALARRYRDEIGRLHQDLARIAARVVLVVAGLPLQIK